MSELPSQQNSEIAEEISDLILPPKSDRDNTNKISDQFEHIETAFVDPFKALVHNLETIEVSLSLPFEFAYAHVRELAFQRFFIAEKIRARGNDNQSEAEREAWARDRAKKGLSEETATEDGSERLAYTAVKFLQTVLEQEKPRSAAQHVSEQAVASSWSAFESFSRYFTKLFINSYPHRLLGIDSSMRRELGLNSISIEELSEFEFDLSESLGSLLVERFNFSRLPKVIALYNFILPQAHSLQSVLKRPPLYELYKCRNLFVHRRGIVDQRFIKETAFNYNVGDKLILKREKIYEYIDSVAQFGIELCNELKRSQKYS